MIFELGCLARTRLKAYRVRRGDGVQSEEVAAVHFPEDTVQLGRLVVQETQRCHCCTNAHMQPLIQNQRFPVTSC